MSLKKIQTGPARMVEEIPFDTVEFCDCCEREMQDDVYPRFELQVDHRDQAYGDDEGWTSRFFSVCSVQCLTRLAGVSANWPQPRRELSDVTGRPA